MLASARSLQHDAISPSSPQQQGLPTGPTHVAARATRPTRTAAEVESNRTFLAAAGRVEFGRHEATLERVWMAHAFYASLSGERECRATTEHLAVRAKRSASTVRTHQRTLIARSLIETDTRKGGRESTRWRVMLPAEGNRNCWAGQQKLLGRATETVAEGREGIECTEKSTYVRTDERTNGPTNEPPVCTDNSPVLSSTKALVNVKFSRQTMKYAKLYRKIQTADWPELTDKLLQKFEEHDYGAKKTILDALETQETTLSAAGKITGAPSSMTPLVHIGGGTDIKAICKGLRERNPLGERRYRQDCAHDWDEYGSCLVCGASGGPDDDRTETGETHEGP